MKYRDVCLEAIGYTLPGEVVSSAEIERRLEPLYSRLRLPEGRLELMTGIRQRRLWPAGTLPSEMSVRSAARAIDAAGIERREIGALVHGSVCRDHLEPAMASLTIGSASAAVLLVHREQSRTGNRLLCATARSNTEQHRLCRGGRDEAVAGGMQPLMETDAEALMHEGVAIGRETLGQFLDEVGWSQKEVSKTACHQVGSAHRKMMLESFGLESEKDFVTYPWLGNTGAAALPVTLAIGIEQGHYKNGDRIAMLGIGSGINVLMMALELKQGLISAVR
jgi:3-oxoacyl-[acyl-carrier-protein] synthase III